jgi:hypothetical protein
MLDALRRYASLKNPANRGAMNRIRLDSCLVRNRSNALRPVVLHRNGPCLSWHHRLPLQVDLFAFLLRRSSLGSVILYAAQELFSAARVLDVLDPDVDSLLEVAVANLLMADDADCGLCNVVYDARLAVIDLVRHACANYQSQRGV